MNTPVIRSLSEIRQLFDQANTPAEKAQIISANVEAARYVEGGPKRDTLLSGLRELAATIPTQCDTSVASEQRESAGLDHLAKHYLSTAIASLTRVPSPKLKSDFRATLMHWRGLLLAAMKTSNSDAGAFTNTVMAVVETEGTFDALRMIRNVNQQLLWLAAVDIAKDRRSTGDMPDPSSFNDGEADHEDADATSAPTEDEAIDSYTEAQAWLSNVADLLALDEDDRIRLGLEDGLEFTQVKEGDNWVRVYDLSYAIETQIEKNLAALRLREARKVLARKDAFTALERLAA